METKTNPIEARRCPACDEAMQARGYKPTQQVGHLTVHDGSSMQPTCPACGTVDMPLTALHVYEVRAAQVALHDAMDRVHGPELRCIRKTLGLTQKQLAKVLGCDNGTICRMETGDAPVAQAIRVALLSLVDLMSNGVEPDELMRLGESGPPSSDTPVEVRRTG